MAIFKIRGELLYGFASKKTYADEKYEKITVSSKLRDRIGALRKKGFKCEGYREYDPIGEEIIDCWDVVPYDAQEDPEIPKRYPGYYYWVWHNGAFFEVIGETERYVLVWVQEGNYLQADALGIDRKKVEGVYYEGAEVERWWLHKSEIKQIDEFGRGKYVYLWLDYYRGVYPVEDRFDEKMIVRGRMIYSDWYYEDIKKAIEVGIFPWPNNKYKAYVVRGHADVWKEDEWMVFEATFDINIMKKVREETRGKFDFYLYGEEEVPYRL